MRNFLLAVAVLALAGCGGSGGSDIGSSGSSSGGSSSSGSGPSSYDQAMSTATAANVQTVVLDQGPSGLTAADIAAVNTIYTSVMVCAPGSTSNCQLIDHIQVDTGSEGLRIISSVLSSTLAAALPQVTVGADPLYECIQFVDGYSWGTVVTADLHVGGTTTNSGETAAGIPVQIIGAGTASPPEACTTGYSASNAENTVATFGANGILGVGSFPQDCGTACTTTPTSPWPYFTCPSGANCTAVQVALDGQVPNPVSEFTTDNNGVVIQLPSIPAAGQALVAGTLTFGIGTESNNALGSATVMTLDPDYGYFTTDFEGTTYSDSYIDSGSNALYINNSTIAQCVSGSAGQGFLCPSSTLSESATNTGTNGASTSVDFSIANATTLFSSQPDYAAFDNLAGTDPVASTTDNNAFGWGVPFFFGRTIFTSIEGSGADGTDYPFFAY
ncbi:MAG TPA: DUF3443 domain-containing protein [Steroidobacteraceae bacterium]|nr:DUF3443 domain-containing protein [Steroidobacteraceae bacterium]